MKLIELLDGIYDRAIEERFRKTKILSVSSDSRKAMMGGLFVALKGAAADGNDFIDAAVEKGVFAVVTADSVDVWKAKYPKVCFLRTDDPDALLQGVVAKLFGNPSESVRTIGITGTNGKTTVAYLLEAVFQQAGKESGVIGTVNYRLGDNIVPAGQTTPSFIDNQHFLTGLSWQSVPYCVIEVSSHALTQGRVRGIDFAAGVFTNLTGDHLDYHKTTEQYFDAKAKLFTGLAAGAAAVINTDDEYGRRLAGMTKARVITYGTEQSADVTARDIHCDMNGSRFTLVCAQGEIDISTGFIGKYNIYNILAAAAVSLAENMDLQVIKDGVASLKHVPGRLERVECGQDFPVFIDYAHTQDALANVLLALRAIDHTRILLVFGCGGDRDRSKRLLMGQVASRLADFSYVTSDNPRSEDPKAIIDEITPGFEGENYKVVVDREEAIRKALEEARAGDTVLIAGKGHETTQVLADGKIDFDERAIITKFLS